MVMQFNGATTSTAITGGMGMTIPNSSQTAWHYTATTNGAAQDFYTVPANKTLYVTALEMVGVSCGINVYENDGATKVWVDTTSATVPNASTPPGFIAVYTTGQIVKINGTNGGSLNAYGVLV